MKNREVFIDTGAYLSRFHIRDGKHDLSREIWQKLRDDNRILITSNHVLDELATLLGRRTNFEFAARKLKQIYEADIQIERTDEKDELKALKFIQKYADQNISFTDCLSFVIMQRLKIKQVFSFDKHFEFSGFELVV